jgi:hypothetical protein
MQHLKLKSHWHSGSYHCYRLNYRADYDEEMVWKLVQQHGGKIAIEADHIDFWIDPGCEEILVLAFPDLQRVAEKDRRW